MWRKRNREKWSVDGLGAPKPDSIGAVVLPKHLLARENYTLLRRSGPLHRHSCIGFMFDPPYSASAADLADAIIGVIDAGARVINLSVALQGPSPSGRGSLQPIYGWFSEGFATADLKEAKVLLDELA
jgi:hypothetical protein